MQGSEIGNSHAGDFIVVRDSRNRKIPGSFVAPCQRSKLLRHLATFIYFQLLTRIFQAPNLAHHLVAKRLGSFNGSQRIRFSRPGLLATKALRHLQHLGMTG